jgi:hypothetical protein
VVVFVSVLLTLALWVPLRNKPERNPDGTIVTETYFGLFRYATLHSELKEPNYKMRLDTDAARTIFTAAASVSLWVGVVYWLRVTRKQSALDRANAQ